MDNEIKILANNDRYARHLTTIPGISYYAALLISSEIADINRFPDYEQAPINQEKHSTQRLIRKAVRC